MYIENYSPIAKEEMLQYGIPASITLAQGILESGAGRGELSAKSNNHFGIKCHKGWTGGVFIMMMINYKNVSESIKIQNIRSEIILYF